MFVEKDLLGSIQLGFATFHYFVIKKEDYYGIELTQDDHLGSVSEIQYFSESYDEAYKIGMAMKDGLVTLTTMNDILDDYIQ